MQKKILAYKDIRNGGYSVMLAWSTGDDIADIKRIDSIYKFGDIDDVRKMAEALNSILERWGDTDCTNTLKQKRALYPV